MLCLFLSLQSVLCFHLSFVGKLILVMYCDDTKHCSRSQCILAKGCILAPLYRYPAVAGETIALCRQTNFVQTLQTGPNYLRHSGTSHFVPFTKSIIKFVIFIKNYISFTYDKVHSIARNVWLAALPRRAGGSGAISQCGPTGRHWRSCSVVLGPAHHGRQSQPRRDAGEDDGGRCRPGRLLGGWVSCGLVSWVTT